MSDFGDLASSLEDVGTEEISPEDSGIGEEMGQREGEREMEDNDIFAIAENENTNNINDIGDDDPFGGNGSGISSLDGSDWGDDNKKNKVVEEEKDYDIDLNPLNEPRNAGQGRERKPKIVLDFENLGDDDNNEIKLDEGFFDRGGLGKQKKVENLDLGFLEGNKKEDDWGFEDDDKKKGVNLDFDVAKKPDLFGEKRKESVSRKSLSTSQRGSKSGMLFSEPKPNLDYRNKNLRLKEGSKERRPDMDVNLRKTYSKPSFATSKKSLRSPSNASSAYHESLRSSKSSFHPKQKSTKSAFEVNSPKFKGFDRDRPNIDFQRKKGITKSYSEARFNMKKKQPFPEEILARVYKFIAEAEDPDKFDDILGYFHQLSKGKYLMREMNELLDFLIEREKTEIVRGGPFRGIKIRNGRKERMKVLLREEELGKTEIKLAEKELGLLVDEENRIKHPLYLNELRDEIKRVIEEIAQTKHIIKIGRSKSKKDMKELDRLIDGLEVELVKKRRRLLQFEREVDNKKVNFDKNLDDFNKMRKQLKNYKDTQGKQAVEIERLRKELGKLGVADFGKVKTYQGLRKSEEEIEKKLKVYRRNYKIKEKRGNKEVDELQKQNEILSHQIDNQEMIIEQQLNELQKMLRKEREYQMWVQEENLRMAREEANLRRSELDRENEMKHMMEDLLDEESFHQVNKYINRTGESSEEVNQVGEEDGDIQGNSFGLEEELSHQDPVELLDNEVGVGREVKQATDEPQEQGNKRTISIQANTIDSAEFRRMVEEDRGGGRRVARAEFGGEMSRGSSFGDL